MVSACSMEGLETKVSHTGSQPYLHDQAPIKTLDTKAGVSPLVGRTLCELSHILARRTKCCSCNSTGRDNWKLALGLSWALSHVSFPTVDFNPYPFTVINCDCELTALLISVSSSESQRLKVTSGTLNHSLLSSLSL